MSGLLNKVKDLASSNSNNSGSTDTTGTSTDPNAQTTQASGVDGFINKELTNEGVPAQYDQKIDSVVDSEIKKYE